MKLTDTRNIALGDLNADMEHKKKKTGYPTSILY